MPPREEKPTPDHLCQTAHDAASEAREAVPAAEEEIWSRITAAYSLIDHRNDAAMKAFRVARFLQKDGRPSEAIEYYNDAEGKWKAAAAVDVDRRAQGPDPGQELANVRTLAKEWLAAALALFGLFSFSVLFFGGDALAGLVGNAPLVWIFLVAGLGALVAAVLCNFLGTRAAHGWPHKPIRKQRLEEGADAAHKLERAREDLKAAVICAGVTVLGIVVALGVVVAGQISQDPPTLLQVRLTSGGDGPCGQLVTASVQGVTIRQENSKPTQDISTPWTRVRTVDAVRSC